MSSQLSTTCSNGTEVDQRATPIVAVEHNQLQTMASEKVDPIDCRYHRPFIEQYPLDATCTAQIDLCSTNRCKSMHGIIPPTFRIRGNHLAHAASWDII